MVFQPGLHFRRLVRTVVIQDQVQFERRGTRGPSGAWLNLIERWFKGQKEEMPPGSICARNYSV